ncbi:M48 family metalloprotease [Thalassospira marina]|uniref:Peptidase M48 n=1 Tax=Thalassospira marina TaxID=2048283 RepID=A0ABN5FRH4_9PROT|nr:M48 family metalloprotease [Thalassospira marina]AUG54280.1 peptidase M48 [Thalassospira marina]
MAEIPPSILRFLALRAGGATHTSGLLACMAGVLSICAWLLGGPVMMISAFFAITLLLLLGPMVSSDMIMKLLRATELPRQNYPALFEMAALLSERAGLDYTPRLYVLPGKGVNAITTGKDENTIIALSRDAIDGLSPRQLRAVLAHEIAHAWHNDTRILMMTDILYRATWTMAVFGMFMFFFDSHNPPVWLVIALGAAPSISFILQRAVIRDREFAADHGASDLLGGPEDVIDALTHIEQINRRTLRLIPYRSTEPPALLDTHPTIKARLEALHALPPVFTGDFFRQTKR